MKEGGDAARVHSARLVSRRPAAEAVPDGGVRAQAVLRDVALLRVRPAVGGEGVYQQEPEGPHAELAAGDHVPGEQRRRGGRGAGAGTATLKGALSQLILKSKCMTALGLQWVWLRGPYGEAGVRARIAHHSFGEDAADAPPLPLPLQDAADTNRLLSNKAIHFR